MSAHTPGPWRLEHMRGVGNVECIGVGSDAGTVANCGTDGLANARLIAAAPDLLAALIDLRKELRCAINMDVKKHFSLLVADVAADKAIDKAVQS